MTTKIYRIRNINPVLFSNGAVYPQWQTIGKIWYGYAPLKIYLSNFSWRSGSVGINYLTTIYANLGTWEIAEFIVTDSKETLSSTIPGTVFIANNF